MPDYDADPAGDDAGTELTVADAGDVVAYAAPTPDAMIRAFRLLTDRVPGFAQLSVDEERSMMKRSLHEAPQAEREEEGRRAGGVTRILSA